MVVDDAVVQGSGCRRRGTLRAVVSTETEGETAAEAAVQHHHLLRRPVLFERSFTSPALTSVFFTKIPRAVRECRIEDEPDGSEKIRLAYPVLTNDHRWCRKGVDDEIGEVAEVDDLQAADV